jgi:Flp pilus assembly protein TadG
MLRKVPQRRVGAAAVELAILLPFLAYLFAIAVDWSRIIYYSVIVNNCARNGAIYASDPYSGMLSPYADITQAAQADAPNLSPPPSVTSASGADANGYSYVDCTVTYNFQTITNLPGVPKTTAIVRTVRVYPAPGNPK